MFLLRLFLLALGLYQILGQSYLTSPNCVPMCTTESYKNMPINGGPPCMCRMDAFPNGCQISPCLPGDDTSDEYVCQCTQFEKPRNCVVLRCDNGTTSYAAIYSSCPSYSVLPGSYPSSNYPSSNYQPYSRCGNYCYCDGDQPPDCDGTGADPINGGPPCSCKLGNWPDGCTLKTCSAGDDFCECSPEFNGTNCYNPRCSV